MGKIGIAQSGERRNSPLDWLCTILSTSVAERHKDANGAGAEDSAKGGAGQGVEVG
jgi:hypothetical protein